MTRPYVSDSCRSTRRAATGCPPGCPPRQSAYPVEHIDLTATLNMSSGRRWIVHLLFISAFAAGIGLSSAGAEELVYVPNFYTMSTWNPYQVLVMRSDLQLKAEAH